MNTGDLVTLDDGKNYVVISKANYKDKLYYCFIEENDFKVLHYYYVDNDELVSIDQDDIDQELIQMLYEDAKKGLNDII